MEDSNFLFFFKFLKPVYSLEHFLIRNASPMLVTGSIQKKFSFGGV